MTESLRGNIKHKALNPKQTQSTNDQMNIYVLDFDIWIWILFRIDPSGMLRPGFAFRIYPLIFLLKREPGHASVRAGSI